MQMLRAWEGIVSRASSIPFCSTNHFQYQHPEELKQLARGTVWGWLVRLAQTVNPITCDMAKVPSVHFNSKQDQHVNVVLGILHNNYATIPICYKFLGKIHDQDCHLTLVTTKMSSLGIPELLMDLETPSSFL